MKKLAVSRHEELPLSGAALSKLKLERPHVLMVTPLYLFLLSVQALVILTSVLAHPGVFSEAENECITCK